MAYHPLFEVLSNMTMHKPINPLRPTVTCRETALYNTSKFLSDILSRLQNHNGYSINNSTEFTEKRYETNIDDITKLWFYLTPWYRYSQRFRLTEHVNLKHRTKLSTVTSSNFYGSRFPMDHSLINQNFDLNKSRQNSIIA